MSCPACPQLNADRDVMAEMLAAEASGEFVARDSTPAPGEGDEEGTKTPPTTPTETVSLAPSRTLYTKSRNNEAGCLRWLN